MYEFLLPTLEAIRNSAFAQWVASILGYQQAAETVHMTFFSVVVGSIVLLTLRLLGVSPRVPVDRLARLLFPAIWIGFAGLVISGSFMFAPRATRIARDQLFQLKLSLLIVVVISLVVIQFAVRRYAVTWETQGVPVPIRVVAAGCLVLAPTVVVVARFMYVL